MTFETTQNPAVYLSGERVSIFPVMVPHLLVNTSPPKRPNVITGKIWYKPGPDVIKLFSYSSQLSMKFQLFMNSKMVKYKAFSCFQTLRYCIFHIIKMPTITIVGILKYVSKINFMLS